MRMRQSIAGRGWSGFAALVVLLSALIWATSAFADGGVVEGKLRNGTAGAALPAGLPVALERLNPDGTPGQIEQTKADEQGGFRFAAVDATAGYTYTVSAKYQEVTYRSDPFTLADGKTPSPVALAVYETTNDESVLSVDLAHAVLEPDPESQGLWVIEVTVFNNGGDRTFVGDPQRTVEGKRPTLRFSVPDGAQHLQPTQGLNPDGIFEIVNGFAGSDPVPPGKREVAYSYMVPMQGKDATYSRAVDYPTKRFAVLAADAGGKIEAPKMAQGEPVDLGGRRYQTFAAQDLPAGGAVMLRVAGAVAAGTKPTDLATIVGGVAVLTILVGLAIYLRRRRSAPKIRATRTPAQMREKLLVAIADLDDAFEAGEIDEEEYRVKRAARKRRLARLLQAPVEG